MTPILDYVDPDFDDDFDWDDLDFDKIKSFKANDCHDEQGRFCSDGGETTDETKPLHEKAEKKANGILAKFKSAFDKITNVPLLKQIKTGLTKVKALAKSFHGKLAQRYGDKAATAIMASGTVADIALTGGGALLGKILTFPGASIIWSLPAVAMAETYLQTKKLFKDGEELSLAEIEHEGRQMASRLNATFLDWLETNAEKILETLESE